MSKACLIETQTTIPARTERSRAPRLELGDILKQISCIF